MRADTEHTVFAERAQRVLEESVSHIDAHTRSRLNQARQAALAAVEQPQRAAWRPMKLMPVTGALAAFAVAVLLVFQHGGQVKTPVTEGSANSLEVLDLLADDEAMSLMEDSDRSFYEWAADESDGAAAAPDSASASG